MPEARPVRLRLKPWPYAAALACACSTAPAAVDHYDVSDGLSQNSVVAIERDARGLLWLGTEDGLNRFDGQEFRAYRADLDGQGLPHGFVQRLARSGEVLWIGTIGGGLARMQLAQERVEALAQFAAEAPPARGSVQALLPRSAERVLAGTPDGLYQVDWPLGGQPQIVELALAAATTRIGVRALAALAAEDLLVATDAGACLWRSSAGACQWLSDLPAAPVLAATSLADHYWLSVDGLGVLALSANGERRAQLRFEQELPTGVARILALLPVADGSLWLGTDQGAQRVDAACVAELLAGAAPRDGCIGERVDELDPDAGQGRKLVYSLLGDDAGGLWIGAWNHGLERYDPRRQAISRHRVRLPGRGAAELSAVRAIAPLGETLWLGSYGGGVVRATPAGSGYRYEQPAALVPGSVAAGLIWALLPDPDGRLWIGSDLGLQRWNDSDQLLQDIELEQAGERRPISSVRSLLRDRSGRIWIGAERGLLRIDQPQASDPVVVEAGEGLPDRRVFALHEDRDGSLLVGTWSGVWRLPEVPGAMAQPLAPQAQLRVVWDIAERAEGGVWVGSSDGLVAVEQGGQWRRYTEADGLANRVVYSIQSDPQGLLWLSSNRGIMRLDPRSGTVINFGAGDPLQDVEFMFGSHARDPVGRIYFGGPRGYNRIDPARVATGDEAPLPLLTAVTIDGHELLADDPRAQPAVAPPSLQGLQLRPGDSVLELRFGAIAYDQPSETRFRYRLDGFDHRWQNSGLRRFASYTNLPPGDYRFEVEAVSRFGQASREPRRLAVEVLPHWYQTWAVRVLAGLLLLAAVGLLVQRRVQRLERQRQALEQEVRERTAEIASQRDALAAQQAELQRVNAELARQSLRDSLTGLPNRRALLQALEKARQAQRAPLSLALVDLDHFKRINDQHGHAAGDAALVHLAALWSLQLPSGCQLGRLGGEEFLLLLDGMALAQARALCLQLLERLRSAPVPWQPPLALRASLGLIELDPQEATEAALARADQALYVAKRDGRDRLVEG